ncbi:hypothetical protein VZT92_001926 [Zoarces viviparus]|uniref:Prolactin receptor n=1 Tax=Zoarces viviparus TaxID=48416 RepID=A0AAW1G5F3_ZOAVI
MNQCTEDREEAVPPSKTSRTKAQRTHQRPESPEPGPEPSCVSLKSDASMESPLDFIKSSDGRVQQHRPDCPEASCLSFKSNQSKQHLIELKGQPPCADQM